MADTTITMPYTFLEHTADVRMQVKERTFPDVLRQAMLGMFDFMKPVAEEKEVRRNISAHSPDSATLLIDFLNEALSLSQANKEAYTSVDFTMLSPLALRATLRGRAVSSFGEDIKAATYHEARVEHTKGGIWQADVIFDI